MGADPQDYDTSNAVVALGGELDVEDIAGGGDAAEVTLDDSGFTVIDGDTVEEGLGTVDTALDDLDDRVTAIEDAPASGGPTAVVLATDYATTGSPVTKLTIPLEANHTYRVILEVEAISVSSGAAVAVSELHPTSATVRGVFMRATDASAGIGAVEEYQEGLGSFSLGNASGSGRSACFGSFIVKTAGTAGNLEFQFSRTGAAGTVVAGTRATYEQVV